MMSDYKETLTRRCEDQSCPHYGQPLVDRGYGFPVCQSVPLRSKVNLGAKNLPMSKRYLAYAMDDMEMGLHRL